MLKVMITTALCSSARKKKPFLHSTIRPGRSLHKYYSRLFKIRNITADTPAYIDKYLAGKRDHTINRFWNLQKGVLAWGVGYLLLREVFLCQFSFPSATSTQDLSLCSLLLPCTMNEMALSTPLPPILSSLRMSLPTKISETTRPILT